jgi:rubrerythrin
LVGGENNMDERLKALEIAMKLEEEGKKFYMDASEKATSAYAKEMFGSLAKDEDVHQEKVNEIYKKLKEEKEWPKVVTTIGDVVKTKAVFPKDVKDLNMTEEDISEGVKVLGIGIEMEEKSILKRGSISHLRMRSVDIISVSGIIGNILRTLRDGLV